MFNESGIFGTLIIGFTNSVTGDITLTLFTLIMLIMLFFIAMRIPIELTAILVIPLLIVFMIYDSSNWKPIAGMITFYLAIMFARFFMR
jgi:hypothetical protein